MSKNEPVAVSDKERQNEWETQEDLRTLKRACEIMKDKDRLKRVKELVGEEQDALEELGDLKGLRRSY